MQSFRSAVALMMTLLVLASTSAEAKLDRYGVVVGRPVAYYLEGEQGEGRWPHYVIDIDTSRGRYQAVINMHTRDGVPLRHRAVPIGDDSNYGSIFSLSEGLYNLPFHTASGAPTGGALDLIRHPGIRRDTATVPWEIQQTVANGVSVPLFDGILDGAARVYVFGEPFANPDGRKGIHDVHQNQGNFASEPFSYLNGIWQDGGLIVEYPPQLQWVNSSSGWVQRWVVNRTLVVTRFEAQSDFTNASGTGNTPRAVTATNQSALGGRWVNYGPFATDQIEVDLEALAGDPDVYLRAGARPTDSAYSVASMNDANIDEYARGYDSTAPQFYVAVKAYGTSTARWNLVVRYRQP